MKIFLIQKLLNVNKNLNNNNNLYILVKIKKTKIKKTSLFKLIFLMINKISG